GPGADFDHMAAQHHDHAAPTGGARHQPRDVARVLGRQHVRERVPESGEAPVAAGRVREQGRVDFVGALRDGNGLESGKVRFAVVGHGCSAGGAEYSLSFSVTWPNEKLDCNASMMRGCWSESHIRASALSAKMPPPLGMRGRTTIASHFLPATLTRSRFSTSTMTGLRSGRK